VVVQIVPLVLIGDRPKIVDKSRAIVSYEADEIRFRSL